MSAFYPPKLIAKPVASSLPADLIRFSNPDWIERLRRGVHLILMAIIGAILGMGIVGLASYFVFQNWRNANPLILLIPEIVIGLLCATTYVVGIWLFTMPDPSLLGEKQYGGSRKFIRITLIFSILGCIFSLVPFAITLPPNLAAAMLLVGGVGNLINTLGFFAELDYISKLSLRIRDIALSRRARVLIYGFGICFGFIIVAGVGFTILQDQSSPQTMSDMAQLFNIAFMLAALAGLVLFVLYIILLEKLSKRLKEQWAIAKKSWNLPMDENQRKYPASTRK